MLLWMDEILHRLKKLWGDFPCKYQQTMACYGFKVVQIFVHPQYPGRVLLNVFSPQVLQVKYWGGVLLRRQISALEESCV